MTEADICVIVPVFRDSVGTAERLADIAAQSMGRFHCLVADNAPSTEAPYTSDIPLPDERFVLLRTDGINEARVKNTALSRVTQPWVLFLEEGSLLPTALEGLWEAASVSRADLIYSGWYEKRRDGSFSDRAFPYDGAMDAADLTDRLILPLCCERYRAGGRQIPSIWGAAGHALLRTQAIARTGVCFREDVPNSALWFDLDLLFGGARAACVRDCLHVLPQESLSWREFTRFHEALWDDLCSRGISRAAQYQLRAQLWHRARACLWDVSLTAEERRAILSDPVLRLYCRHPRGLSFPERLSAKLFLPGIQGVLRGGMRGDARGAGDTGSTGNTENTRGAAPNPSKGPFGKGPLESPKPFERVMGKVLTYEWATAEKQAFVQGKRS